MVLASKEWRRTTVSIFSTQEPLSNFSFRWTFNIRHVFGMMWLQTLYFIYNIESTNMQCVSWSGTSVLCGCAPVCMLCVCTPILKLIRVYSVERWILPMYIHFIHSKYLFCSLFIIITSRTAYKKLNWTEENENENRPIASTIGLDFVGSKLYFRPTKLKLKTYKCSEVQPTVRSSELPDERVVKRLNESR